MNKIPEFREDPTKKQKQLLDYYSVLEPLVMGPVYGKGKITTNDEVASIVKTEKPKLNSYIVSDSIFLWTDDVSFQSFITIIDVIKHLIMTNFSWSSGFPIRGGVAMGSITFQHNEFDTSKLNIMTSLVGDALVKAAVLEVNQNWSGCMVDEEIMTYFQNKFPDRNIENELRHRQLLIRYPIPLKKPTKNLENLAIIWPSHYEVGKQNIYDLPVKMTFERNGSLSDPLILTKYENTIKFVHELFQIYAY
jgi:hypothetical protein